jgi:hypothetical protein
MNNKKTIKTLLFASLIAAMILPFSGIDFAEARVDKDNEAEKMAKYEQKLEKFKQKALNDGNIPDSELVDRMGDKWKNQYKNDEEFNNSRAEIIAYVTGDHPDNKWNKIMVKEHIRIQNFETLIDNRGHGLELVSLFAAKEKLLGTYSPSDQVKKYHDWTASQYEIPTTVDAIDERIHEIIGDRKYMPHAKQAVNAYNNMAEHGSVPMKLSNIDDAYWLKIAHVAVCKYDNSCDAEATLASLNSPEVTPEQLDAFREFESTNGIDPESGEPYECIFIQCAYAAEWVQIHLVHTLTAFVQPASCDIGSGSTCKITATPKTGTGALQTSIVSGTNHATDNYVQFQAISTTTDSNGVNEISANVGIAGSDQDYGPVGDFAKAQIWQYDTIGTCGGGSPPSCGEYSITGTSPDAYKWVFQ